MTIKQQQQQHKQTQKLQNKKILRGILAHTAGSKWTFSTARTTGAATTKTTNTAAMTTKKKLPFNSCLVITALQTYYMILPIVLVLISIHIRKYFEVERSQFIF